MRLSERLLTHIESMERKKFPKVMALKNILHFAEVLQKLEGGYSSMTRNTKSPN